MMGLPRNMLGVALLSVGHAPPCLGLAAEAEAAALATAGPRALRHNVLQHERSAAFHGPHGSQAFHGSQNPLLAKSKFPVMPASLAIFADECKCAFIGLCTCEASVEFMTCVAQACHRGTCNCSGGHRFREACEDMSATCPSTGLQCSNDAATCLSNPVQHTDPAKEINTTKARLRELKVEKCRLEDAIEDGWVNADNRLEDLLPEIQAGVDSLGDLGVTGTDMPSLNCSEPFLAAEATHKETADESFAEGSSWAPLPVALALLFASRSL